jgi:GNAT superfamily N-acetyltransferase
VTHRNHERIARHFQTKLPTVTGGVSGSHRDETYRSGTVQYGARMSDAELTAEVTIVPANEASWEDLQAVFGTRGTPARCQCQRFKIRGREWDAGSVPVEERAHRLREQTDCGHPESDTTSGLVAYLDGERVGWCAVEPRTAYVRLGRVPWAGRAEDKTDDSIWAVTCFVTRAGFRRRGISRALARATIDFARQRGARALEGYPMITQPGQEITWGEVHVGSRSIFDDAGFTEVSRPTLRRVVMRIDF